MAKIFISYNRESEPIAQSLERDMEDLGHEAWIDNELSGGQPWWDKILEQIRECDVFAFVLNPGSLKSTACKREYGYAADLGKRILPFLVSDAVATNLLPEALSKIQFVLYEGGDRDSMARLALALRTLPDPGPLPDPLPEPPEVPLSYLGSLATRVGASETLSLDEQSALLFKLRGALREEENCADARTLLKRMRARRDLFAAVRDEVDDLLAGKGDEKGDRGDARPAAKPPPLKPPEPAAPKSGPAGTTSKPAATLVRQQETAEGKRKKSGIPTFVVVGAVVGFLVVVGIVVSILFAVLGNSDDEPAFDEIATTTQYRVQAIHGALLAYFNQYGFLPAVMQSGQYVPINRMYNDLTGVSTPANPAGVRFLSLGLDETADDWGSSIVANYNGVTLTVGSAGPDRTIGTPDDIFLTSP